MVRQVTSKLLAVGAAAIGLGAASCVADGDAGAAGTSSATQPRIEFDRERCFPNSVRETPRDGPYTAGPVRPEPRIAQPGPPINSVSGVPRFIITNSTGERIVQFFTKSPDTSEWGADHFETDETLAPEQFCTARVVLGPDESEDNCAFDLRAVTDSGRVIERTGFDACSASRITLD